MINVDLTKKYALAVSGGIDSMAMLHMFAEFSPRPDFFVVTVNHNIRKESAADCTFVKEQCDALGVTCISYSVDVLTYCRENKVSTETGARLLRYGIFDELDCDYVCLAHHADDNAETVLMHVLRGSGAGGASGMKYCSGKYLRPLLQYTRGDIESYVKKKQIPYVIDSTNEEIRYTRNFIRRKIMPLLKTINENAEKNILRFADNISCDDVFLESLADISSVVFDGDTAKIPVALLRQPSPLAYRVIRKTFARLNVYKDVEKTHLEAITELARAFGGTGIDLPFGYRAVNEYDYVVIAKKIERQIYDFEIPFSVGVIQTPIGTADISQREGYGCLKFDLNAVPKTAVLRAKREGDVFCKFGGGTKTLKKYLIDKKIPSRERSRLLLLADGNEVLLIFGVEISEKIKITDNSTAFYARLIKE